MAVPPSEPLRMSWAQACARRLDRHALSTPAGRPADVVRAICGAHAQILSAAELSVAVRTAGLTRTDIREALWNERSLVKTRGPRGTVHLLPTEDLPMWTGALSATPLTRNMHDKDDVLTREQIEAVVAGLAVVLAAEELTADELTAALADQVGSWAGDPALEAFQGTWPRWFQAMDVAANRGVLCFGPNRGRRVTYTSPQRWLPGFQPAEGSRALAALVRSYLHAYGPATPQQFAQWLAVPRRWASDLFDSLAGELAPVELAGARAWLVAGDTDLPAEPPRGVRLLPYFDAYPVGCFPRELLFPGAAATRALAAGQAGNYPVLLVDGTVAGVWHQRRSGRRIHVTVEPVVRLSAGQRRELGAQAERVGQILEGTAELTVGTVTVGPHV